jgi:hypothetical protein
VTSTFTSVVTMRHAIAIACLAAIFPTAANAQQNCAFGGPQCQGYVDLSVAELIINGANPIQAKYEGTWSVDFDIALGGGGGVGPTRAGYLNGLFSRSFFVFDTPDVEITSAELRLNTIGVLNPGLFALFDYVGTMERLLSPPPPFGPGYNQGLAQAAFRDLGDGKQYGAYDYSVGDVNQFRNIALNEVALQALNASRGGDFVMGGRLTTSEWYLTTNDNLEPPVVVTPEPSSVLLLFTGLLCIAGLHRRRLQQRRAAA